jgi:hypothetical protein
LNVAETVLFAVMLIVQVAPEGVSQPDQLTKLEPDAATAIRVTDAPDAYGRVQSVPQLMPAGDEVTVPVPVPAIDTVRVYPELSVVAQVCCDWADSFPSAS